MQSYLHSQPILKGLHRSRQRCTNDKNEIFLFICEVLLWSRSTFSNLCEHTSCLLYVSGFSTPFTRTRLCASTNFIFNLFIYDFSHFFFLPSFDRICYQLSNTSRDSEKKKIEWNLFKFTIHSDTRKNYIMSNASQKF